jgi:hypothetical protein
MLTVQHGHDVMTGAPTLEILFVSVSVATMHSKFHPASQVRLQSTSDQHLHVTVTLSIGCSMLQPLLAPKTARTQCFLQLDVTIQLVHAQLTQLWP